VHILTKILAVFAALLAIGLSALTIAYTANADRVQSDYQSQVLRAQASEARAAEASANANIAIGTIQKQIDEIGRQRDALESESSQLRQNNARLLTDARQAEAAEQSIRSKIDQLAATSETLSRIVASYREEVATLRTNELRYARNETQLSDRVNDLTGQLEVALENNRALQEQLVEVRTQLATVERGGASASGSGAFASAATPIRARVTVVKRGPAGELLVEINAGSRDQLRANNELSLVRGDTFLGKVRLTRVDPQQSVGVVDFLGRPSRDIREGDTVVSIIQ
jgi:predicted RNase H-like nuclease (RuvC/YqgF family)